MRFTRRRSERSCKVIGRRGKGHDSRTRKHQKLIHGISHHLHLVLFHIANSIFSVESSANRLYLILL